MPLRPLTRTPAGALAVLLVLALAALSLSLAALAVGSVPVGFDAVLHAVTGDVTDPAAGIVRDLRLPRVMAAFGTGGLLALSGALMQVLLRNPLADPYVLGLSGGAAVGALAVLAMGWAALVTPAALGGAMVSATLVFGLARGRGGDTAWSPTRLLLTGVVVASGWSAAIALLLSLAPETQLKGMLFWLLGDLSATGSGRAALVALAAIVATCLALARDLNVMVRGEAVAASLGVATPRLALALYALAALGTAIAVTTAGSIGFVGLVVPHALRLLLGNDQRLLLPPSALAGGALLVLADTVARTAVAPLQLPVGVVTALLGVPVFLLLLARRGLASGVVRR